MGRLDATRYRPWRSGDGKAYSLWGFAFGLVVFSWPATPPRPTAATTSLEQFLASNASLPFEADIAVLNLACAKGLPEAERMDRANCLATLDTWAGQVREQTERHLYRFRTNPSEFQSSEGYFRMLIMAVTLYEDCGIRYNPKRMGISSPGSEADDSFFSDPQDLFLHGLCGARRLGTCSSMPVLYAAIGRRLGYPLKLATTKSHVFLRWDGQGERFNVETTGKGMNRYDDEHFKNWPFPVTEAEAAEEGYLKSLSPAEELALFLSLRGHCLRQAGRMPEAIAAYAAAARFGPETKAYRVLLAHTQDTMHRPNNQPLAGQHQPLPQDPFPGMGPPDPNPLLKMSTPGSPLSTAPRQPMNFP